MKHGFEEASPDMSKPSVTKLSPAEWEAELRWAREEAGKRQAANRMSPEKLAEFKAWVEEKTSQLLPGRQHLLVPPPPGVEPPKQDEPAE